MDGPIDLPPEEIEITERQVSRLRRKFHQLAEPGWCEYQTTCAIVKELADLSFDIFTGEDVTWEEARMGPPPELIDDYFFKKAEENQVPEELLEKLKGGRTGVIAVMDTKKPGPHTALRFDIDALPITESGEDDHLPAREQFRSRQEGSMHACAHDGHTAIGIALAHLLHALRDRLSGKFTLIFQPAEEGSRGAKSIVDKGWLNGVDYFLSGHIGIQPMEVGSVAATVSGLLATTKIDCRFEGKSAHAGLNPHEGKNALLAGAAAALHLETIPPHPEGTTRLNVGTFHAGRGRNIVADEAVLEIETRGSTNKLNEYVVDQAVNILKSSAAMYGVKEHITITGEGVSAVCDTEWIEIAKRAAGRSRREIKIIDSLPFGASEDAAHMMNRVQEQGGKATYMLYGTPLPYSHHHTKFDFDEKTLAAAVDTLIHMILDINAQEDLI
ncbi:amidohydrolase [Salipaludibacillus sp. CUR1]|uniref:amidohydrolase n=1 Tax=Salipaludibacillus sp. CUR1 TaxID=2820003 RepID=UPI001E56FE02|nr:amidohydrolase [Salipaludibacillus sp. CUR1]MCE7792780.1 amidohydrolase [Salipaludibacillus sp. CUR1]